MNLNAYKGSSLFKSPSSSSHIFTPNKAKLEMFTYSQSSIEFHISNFWSRAWVPWGKTSIFDVQTNSDYKTQKKKLYSVRASKRYLNKKNLIHGRVMATILKFKPRLHDEIYRKRFYSNSMIYTLSLSNSHRNVVSTDAEESERYIAQCNCSLSPPIFEKFFSV